MKHLVSAISLPILLALTSCAPGNDDDLVLEDEETETGALNEEISDTWSEGPGFGVRYRRANEGKNIAIFYGGYGASLHASASWLDEAFVNDLEARGVGRLYAVKGPQQSNYAGMEIGNSKIAKRLIAEEGKEAEQIIVIAHSSGAFVANELLTQLADGRDVDGNAAQKIVYFNLDGAGGPPSKALANLAGAWAVSAKDAAGTRSTNAWTADANAAKYQAAGKGGHHVVLTQDGACASGAKWCLHMALTNERPHNKWGLDVANDYTDFVGRPIEVGFLAELGEVLPIDDEAKDDVQP